MLEASCARACSRDTGRSRIPTRAPALPDRFRGPPVARRVALPGRLPRLRRRLPDRRASRPTARGLAPRPRPLPVLHRLRRGVSRRARSRYTQRLPPGHARRARTWSCDGATLELAAGARREDAPALRPLAQAAPGERRRLQRLRGRRERAQHGRLRPGPLRHPVRRLAAPRRRPAHHRPGHREHAARAARRPTPRCPAPKLVIAVGACAISGGPVRRPPRGPRTAPTPCVPVDLYIPGCPPHPLTILDGLLRLLGRIEDGTRRSAKQPVNAAP